MKIPKTKWLLLAAAAVTLFLWTARESFEDTASVQGPPYGNTAASATRLIAIMSPSMLTSIKKQVGVTSETLSDAEKIKIVYGDGTNSSPIAQVMSSFYWQVYKPATSTITLAQLNKFFETYDEAWVKKNIPDVREFLKRYFIQGQNGAAQSGYLDALNTVWGQMAIQAAAPKPEEKKEADKPAPVDNTLMYVAIGISATALFAVVITLLLPARNVL
jgi:NACalpha-BTF3-like transcription factor